MNNKITKLVGDIHFYNTVSVNASFLLFAFIFQAHFGLGHEIGTTLGGFGVFIMLIINSRLVYRGLTK